MDLKNNLNQIKLRYIDALRGYAILAVIAVHISQTDGLKLSNELMNFLSFGQKGVQLFFIVSSFTLFRSFNIRNKSEKYSLINFYLRRIFRIVPMYYIAILFYTLYRNLHNVEIGVIYNLFLIHGLSIKWINNIVPGGWSVGVEFLFYLILPLLISRIKTSNQALNFYIIAILFKSFSNLLLKSILLGYSKNSIDSFIFFSLPNQLPIFAIGILLYFLVSNDNWNINQFKNKQILFLTLLLGFSLIQKNLFFDNNDYFGIIFFFFFYIMSQTRNKLIINKFIIYIGKISFSLYLIHFYIIFISSSFFYFFYSGSGIIDYLVRYFFVFSFSVLVSTLTFYLVENKFQHFGNWIIRKYLNNN